MGFRTDNQMAIDVDLDPDLATQASIVEAGSPPPSTTRGQPSEFDLYKIAVEMADRVSARRTGANNFFVALHGLLATVVGIIGLNVPNGGGSGAATLVAGTAGIVLCAAWWLGLRSYRDLNSAKFKVISAMERKFAVQVFTDEWKYLKEDRVRGWRGRYAEQGTVERLVPFIFGGLYALAIVRTFVR
jgi:hypothetical protein